MTVGNQVETGEPFLRVAAGIAPENGRRMVVSWGASGGKVGPPAPTYR